MNKIKFWKVAKTALATSFVALLAGGVVLLNDSENITAEQVATPKEVKVETLYDVTKNATGTGVYSWSSTAGSYGFGQSSVTENFEFSTHVTLGTNILSGSKIWNVPLGILLEEASGSADAGYWFDIQPPKNAAGEEFAYITLHDGKLGTRGAGAVNKRARASYEPEWYNVFYSPTGFDLRFGAQDYYVGDTFSYTYVYVYINGELYMEYKDTTKNSDAGTYIGGDNNNSRVLYQDLKSAEMTVGDIYDLNPDDGNAYTARGTFLTSSTVGYAKELGETNVTENYEFVAHIDISSLKTNQTLPINILQQDTGSSRGYTEGYCFEISGNKETMTLYYGNKYAGYVLTGMPKAEWYEAAGYDLRFGAKTYYYPDNTFAYTKVYVIINDEIIFDYKDTDKNDSGKYVTSDCGHGRAKIFSANGAEANVLTQDMADVFSGPVLDLDDPIDGTTTVSVSENYALKTKIELPTTPESGYETAYVSFLQGNDYTKGTTGYYLKMDLSAKTLTIIGGGMSGGNYGSTAIPESWYADGGAEIEISVKDYLREGNATHRIITVKSEGEVLLQALDHEMRALGNHVYMEKDNRFSLYTTKTTTEEFGFEMLGASVKISSVGIRFASSVDMATYNALVAKYGEENVQIGTIVIPKQLVASDDITLDTKDVENIVSTRWLKEGETANVYTGVVTGVPEEYTTVDLYARNYLQVTYGGETYVWYGETITRSMKSVAEMALADRVTNFDEAHTAEEYKYSYEEDGVTYYTPYDKDARDLLARYL